MPRTKVRWTEEELIKIRDEFYRLRSEIHGGTDIFILRKAQEVLPRFRQRKFAAKHEVKPALDYIKKHPIVQKREEPPAPREPTFEEALRIVARAFIPIASEEFLQQTARTVRYAVMQAFEMTTADLIRDVVSPYEGERRKKTMLKVAIMSVHPRQEQEILQDYGKVLDIRFVKQTPGVKKNLKAQLMGVDVVVGVKNWIRHSDEWLAAKIAKRYVGVWGGIASIKEALDDIALASSGE